MKKKLGGCLLVLVVIVAGVFFWLRRQALDSEQLVERLRDRITSAIGLPVEWEDLQWSGMNGIAVNGFRVLGSSGAGDEELVSAKSATIRWNWLNAVVGTVGSFDVKLEDARFHIRHSPDHGWNFEPREDAEAKSTKPTAVDDEPNSTRERSSRIDVKIEAAPVVVEVEEEEWGKWVVRTDSALAVSLRGEDEPDRWTGMVRGTLKIDEGTIPPNVVPEDTLLARFLIPVQPASSELHADLAFDIAPNRFVISSVATPSVKFSDASHGIEAGPFSVEVNRDATGHSTTESLSLESLEVGMTDWSSPGIAALRIPWTAPPEGPLAFSLTNVRFQEGEHRFALAGIHIPAVTFAARGLPWLRILTKQDTWGMEDLKISAEFAVRPEEETYSWKEGKLLFSEGRGGSIASSGHYHGTGDPEWSITTQVDRFPLPEQSADGQVYNTGIFSGTMTWGEANKPGEAAVLTGQGKIKLTSGEIGAIRMLGRIDEVLKLEEIATSPFETLSFAFLHQSDRLEIDDFILKSDLLNLSGEGSYTASGKVDIDLLTQPSEKLADAISSERGAPIIRSLSKSNDLRIRITGDLDSPDYSINPGEGVEIPIGEILEGLIKKD